MTCLQPSLLSYSARSQMALDIPLLKTNTGQKRFLFLGPKKINPSSKNITKRLLSCMHERTMLYFICKHKLIQIITTLL